MQMLRSKPITETLTYRSQVIHLTFVFDLHAVAAEIENCPWEDGEIGDWASQSIDMIIEWPSNPSELHAVSRTAAKGWAKVHVTPSWAKSFLPDRLALQLFVLTSNTFCQNLLAWYATNAVHTGPGHASGGTGPRLAKNPGKFIIQAAAVCEFGPQILFESNLFSRNVFDCC